MPTWNNTATISIDNATEPVPIWLLSDIHIGSVSFDEALFLKHKAVAKELGARVWLLGDQIECVSTVDRVAALGALWEQNLTIGEQRDRLLDELDGFTVDIVIEGNHEIRLYRTQGESASAVIVKIQETRQEFPVHYLPHGGFVTVRFGTNHGKSASSGDQTYVTYMHHGEGAPTQLFNKLMSENQGAEVFAAGHNHTLSVTEAQVNTPQGSQRVQWVRTGGYLNDPAYAARKPSTYGKPSTGSYLLWLSPDEHRVQLEKLEDAAHRLRVPTK